MVLDYSIKDPEGRVALVEEVLKEVPNPDQRYMQAMADYMLFAQDPGQTRKERSHESPIVTRNRMATTSKRQTSLEGLVDTLENGEDGLYALMADGPQVLDARDLITDEDIDSIPMMREMRELVDNLSEQFGRASGRDRYVLKRTIIETWQQMYLLKASFKGAWASSRVRRQVRGIGGMELAGEAWLDEEGLPQSDCVVSLFNPAHVSFLMTYWFMLRQDTYDRLDADMRWVLVDLESLMDKALRGKPELREIAFLKMLGTPSDEVLAVVNPKYGTNHSEQYLSTIWRKVIPRLVVEQAERRYVRNVWNNDPTRPWKRCGTCGKVKPAHVYWFPKNSSYDGFYSRCKCCRARLARERGGR